MNVKKTETSKADIIVDIERAHLVRRVFEAYATGEYSYMAITQLSRKIGLTNSRGNKGYLSKSHMDKILRDPFYYGVMHVKNRNEFHPHRYDTIISKELFDQCQDVRNGKKRYVGDYNSKDYLFKGILKCATTDRMVSSETHKKTNKNGEVKEWTYLSSWNPDNPQKKVYVREDDLIDQISEILESIKIPTDKMFKELITYIHKTLKSKQYYHKSETRELKLEHTEIEEKLDKLVELMVDGKITDEAYQRTHRRLKDQQHKIISKLQIFDSSDTKFANHLEYLIKVASGAANYFKSSEKSKKREIIKYIFQNLSLKGKKIEYSMTYPFSEFQKVAKSGEWWV